MSCRRSDRTRFIGCRVGPVRIRGCGRGCPYLDSEIESNERWNYAQQPGIQFDASSHHSYHRGIAPSGNHACKTSYRPKFVCVACRRAFKAAIVEGNQYEIWASSWHMGWWWSPSPSRIPDVWKEYKSICSLPARREEKRRLEEIEDMVLSGRQDGRTFSDEEMDEFKKSNPALWWQPLSALRCPGCGEPGVPVGGTFRAPAQKDARGWAKVSELLAKGEMFNYCLTQDEEKVLIREAEIENERWQAAAGWEETKARRIAELKNTSGRTDEKARKLARIKSVEIAEGWELVESR
ncbi:hypothetical protein DFH06DRAFT_731673 [Mycena polygramma]|nr:hypothetical protein DFH06DRAFT_731673 [Mycena polygramma]